MTGNARRPGAWVTPRAVTRAHKLWLAGTPTAEIARTVGAPSKSALIGYSRRAGWPRRPNPSKPKPVTVKPPVPPKHGQRSPAARTLTHVPPARTCQWPLWPHGARPETPRFCDAPALPGRSWCLVHKRQVFCGRARLSVPLTWLRAA